MVCMEQSSQAAKPAVPVQEGSGAGKEKMKPVLPGYPR